MKLIRITTDNEISTHDFPEGNYAEQNKVLRDLIGNDCRIYERVTPERLYTELNMAKHPTKVSGQCVSMLVDEEGLLKDNEQNLVGSYLYKTDRYGFPIMGNILFVGEKWGGDGIDFCGIDDSVFESLKLQLDYVVDAIKEITEVFGI